jgi:tetratricopeptide (TPR) repeat protein
MKLTDRPPGMGLPTQRGRWYRTFAVLSPPDSHFFSAAVGWLELGDSGEAGAELDRVSPEHQRDVEVLEVRWMLLARENDWARALEVARVQLELHPDHAAGWLHRAYALRRAPGGGLDAAWSALLPARERFPVEPIIPYNLACYACQRGKLDEAREWFQCAVKVGGRDPMKQMALRDPDLEPLWRELERL